jgi:hypothetical protein
MADRRFRIGWTQSAPVAVLLAASALAGCAWRGEVEPLRGSIKDTRPFAPARPAPAAFRPQRQTAVVAPAPDARRCHDVQSCEAQVRALVESPDRAWLRRPETPAQMLTGVRMLAFRALRERLACGELDSAMEQLAAVPDTLRQPPPASTPQEVAYAVRLAAEVREELSGEKLTRCTTAPAAPPSPPPAEKAAQPKVGPAQPTPAVAPAAPAPQPAPPAPAPDRVQQ